MIWVFLALNLGVAGYLIWLMRSLIQSNSELKDVILASHEMQKTTLTASLDVIRAKLNKQFEEQQERFPVQLQKSIDKLFVNAIANAVEDPSADVQISDEQLAKILKAFNEDFDGNLTAALKKRGVAIDGGEFYATSGKEEAKPKKTTAKRSGKTSN